jgi:hypothetical protein
MRTERERELELGSVMVERESFDHRTTEERVTVELHSWQCDLLSCQICASLAKNNHICAGFSNTGGRSKGWVAAFGCGTPYLAVFSSGAARSVPIRPKLMAFWAWVGDGSLLWVTVLWWLQAMNQ